MIYYNTFNPKIIFFLLLLSLSFSIKMHDGLVQGAVYTTFVGYYPDNTLNNSAIYIRGDACNLTWTKGIKLTKTGPN